MSLLLLEGMASTPSDLLIGGLLAPESAPVPTPPPDQPAPNVAVYSDPSGGPTASLPSTLIYWNRPGNTTPAAGYLMRHFPKTWFKSAPNAAALFSSMDPTLDHGRFYLDALRAAHLLSFAAGSDLDDLAALLGIARLDGESDNQLRVRLPSTAQHGVAASSSPAMEKLLSGSLQVPVEVRDIGPGLFQVTLLANTSLYKAAVPLITRVKAAGTKFSARMLAAQPNKDVPTPTFGNFAFGAASVGDTGVYLPLN